MYNSNRKIGTKEGFCGENSLAFIVRFGKYGKKVGLGYYGGSGFYLKRMSDSDFILPLDANLCQEYEVIGEVEEKLCLSGV